MGSVYEQALSSLVWSQALRLATSSGSMRTENWASDRPSTTTTLGSQAWLRSSGCA